MSLIQKLDIFKQKPKALCTQSFRTYPSLFLEVDLHLSQPDRLQAGVDKELHLPQDSVDVIEDRLHDTCSHGGIDLALLQHQIPDGVVVQQLRGDHVQKGLSVDLRYLRRNGCLSHMGIDVSIGKG